jgi:glycosyltransferase involved in cell wall biosynthesis
MRFHLVSLPHTQTTEGFSSCAYTQKVRNFARMMMGLGHEVFLYSGEFNTAPCTEHVSCVSEAERLAALGGVYYTQASFDVSLPHWTKFNETVIGAIRDRIQKKDFICVITGKNAKPIADAFFPGYMTVEFGIGYGGTFSQYKVWESYAWMHTCYGTQHSNSDPHGIDGVWFDAVIPGYLDIEQFPFSKEKDDYFLYVGRLIDRKGWHIAEEVCKHRGKRLIIALLRHMENMLDLLIQRLAIS